jgi:tight adherence protein B
MNNTFIAISVLLFIAVFLAIEGLYLWWNSSRGPEARKISRRLQNMSAGGSIDSESAKLFKQRLLSNSTGISRWLLQTPRIATLDRILVQSGLAMSVTSLLSISVGLFAVGFLGFLTARAPWPIALVVALVLAIIPIQVVLWMRNRRMNRFETLLPEAMDLIGRGLRAGHAFPSAIQMVGQEMPEPVGSEFRYTFDEINFGVNVQNALQNLAKRVPITDLRFFVIAVLIQRETGGNLSEVLENISKIIRDRLKLFGRVKTLSAEGRFSALILTLLPFGTLAMLYLVDPVLTSTLWKDETGLKLIYVTLFFMFLGVLWIRSIIRIKV